MKWKIDSTPKVGGIRTRRVFAWRKTKVGDHYVWLETYQVTEKYEVRENYYGTESGRWNEIDRDILYYVY